MLVTIIDPHVQNHTTCQTLPHKHEKEKDLCTCDYTQAHLATGGNDHRIGHEPVSKHL